MVILDVGCWAVRLDVDILCWMVMLDMDGFTTAFSGKGT